MRIAFLLPSLVAGGAERVVVQLASALAAGDRAMRVDLIVFESGGPLTPLIGSGVELHDLATVSLRRSLLPALKRLRGLGPDVIFSSMLHVNLPLLAARPALPGRPAILVREANLPSLSLPHVTRPWAWRAAMRALYPTATRVIATSDRMVRELEADFSVPAKRLFRLENPVDEARLRSLAAQPLRHSGAGRRFVAAGRLVAQKGFDRLIDMADGLDAEDRVFVFGDGADRQVLTEHAARRGGKVSFKGYSEALPRWLAGADAFLMPSRWEGLPNAALDALACGTPVIATPESGGIAEIAAAAPADAVRIAAAPEEFATAMRMVSPAPPSDLRNSLLPARYRIEKSVRRLRELLEVILTERRQR